MKRHLIPLTLALLMPLAALADGLAVQLRGPGLAESAGFLWAEARGLYAAEGLEVTLLPADDAPPFESLARGAADLAVEWLPTALVAREHGLPVVHVAQILARPGLRLTCRRDSGVESAADLRGRTVASAFRGEEYPLLAWLNRLGLRPEDSLSGVALLRQWPGAGMLRQHQAACVTSRHQDPPAGDGLVELDPATQGAETLEDGLYVLPPALARPEDRDRLARFLRASMRGWHEAVADPETAAHLILGSDPDAGALRRQTGMIRRIGPLLSTTGALEPQAFAGTVANLRAGGTAAVLRRDPQGALSDEITALAAPAPSPATAEATP